MTAAEKTKYVKHTRTKGFLLYNIAGKVRCEGREYWITDSGTFYNAVHFVDHPGAPPKPPTSPDLPASVALTMATQNVIARRLSPTKPSNIGDWKKGETYAKRTTIMADQLKPYVPSIVATQESGDKKFSATFDKSLATALGGSWTDVLYGDGWDISETVTFNDTKYDLIAKGYIKVLPEYTGHSHNVWPFVHLKERKTGIHFFVVSVHTIPGAGTAPSKKREKQVHSGVPQMEKIAGKLPIIWLGDFNNAKGDAYDGVGKAFKTLGYTDVEDTSCPGVNVTRPSYNDLNMKPGTNAKQLERCFIKTTKVTAKKRVVNVQMNGSRYKTPFGSDHWGLVFDLAVKRV